MHDVVSRSFDHGTDGWNTYGKRLAGDRSSEVKMDLPSIKQPLDIIDEATSDTFLHQGFPGLLIPHQWRRISSVNGFHVRHVAELFK
jgi:hypothetical protein